MVIHGTKLIAPGWMDNTQFVFVNVGSSDVEIEKNTGATVDSFMTPLVPENLHRHALDENNDVTKNHDINGVNDNDNALIKVLYDAQEQVSEMTQHGLTSITDPASMNIRIINLNVVPNKSDTMKTAGAMFNSFVDTIPTISYHCANDVNNNNSNNDNDNTSVTNDDSLSTERSYEVQQEQKSKFLQSETFIDSTSMYTHGTGDLYSVSSDEESNQATETMLYTYAEDNIDNIDKNHFCYRVHFPPDYYYHRNKRKSRRSQTGHKWQERQNNPLPSVHRTGRPNRRGGLIPLYREVVGCCWILVDLHLDLHLHLHLQLHQGSSPCPCLGQGHHGHGQVHGQVHGQSQQQLLVHSVKHGRDSMEEE